jgi:hypothetical protein
LHAQSLGPWANFDFWHSDHTAANSVIIPNQGIVSGFFRALFGLANKDQVDTGKAIVAAAKASGQDVPFDTYSNGVNAGGKVAQGMSAGEYQTNQPSLDTAAAPVLSDLGKQRRLSFEATVT